MWVKSGEVLMYKIIYRSLSSLPNTEGEKISVFMKIGLQ